MADAGHDQQATVSHDRRFCVREARGHHACGAARGLDQRGDPGAARWHVREAGRGPPAGGRSRRRSRERRRAGYGTDSEIFFYRDEGRRYQPDLVVLAFNFQNDVIENLERLYRRSNETVGRPVGAETFFELADDGALREVPIVPEPGVTKAGGGAEPGAGVAPVARRASYPSAPRRADRDAAASVRTEPVRPVIFESYAPWTEEWDDACRLRCTTRLVAELRREGRDRTARAFAVVLVPTKGDGRRRGSPKGRGPAGSGPRRDLL